MKLWATLARYAYRSDEFQVRIPFGCKERAAAAGKLCQCGRYRIEDGSLVFGGTSACRAMVVVLDAPHALCQAAQGCLPPRPKERRREAWKTFKSVLQKQIYIHLRDS